MMYKPSEVADELEVSVDSIYRSYLPDGAPYVRDKDGAIWIHGLSFAAWVRMTYRKRNRHPMQQDEAWCFMCNKPVKMVDPKKKQSGRYVIFLQAKCQECGTRINRAIASGVYAKPKKTERKGKAHDQSG
jgi:uncharacterized protein with PIN domain